MYETAKMYKNESNNYEANSSDDFPAILKMTSMVEQIVMVLQFRNRNRKKYYRSKDNEDNKTCNQFYLGGGNDSFTMPCF